jgi:hypothetical protein
LAWAPPLTAFDELLELVEQLPLLPLTPDEELVVCAADELLLQLYAFATWKFVVGIAIIAVIAIIAPNAMLNLCILADRLPTIKDYREDCYSLKGHFL